MNRAVVLVLAGAAAAAVGLVAVTAVRVATDPEIQDCAAAMDAADTANTAHQDALENLDTAIRQGGRHGTAEQRARAEKAQALSDRTKVELDAARDTFSRLCHTPTGGTE